ncbi:MAG TPA: hypothetical protein VF807_11020, partial [Ktedonobacterales bacterium]
GIQLAHPLCVRALTRSGEERRFPNARRPTDEERRAMFIDMVDELLERLYLAFAADEGVHA